jgi:hypothetical protein
VVQSARDRVLEKDPRRRVLEPQEAECEAATGETLSSDHVRS